MSRTVLISLILFCLQLRGHSQVPLPEEGRLSLLFIGDIMCHDSQIWSAENIKTGNYDFNDVFRYVKPLISSADIAVANLEVTLAGPPYKGYPLFSSPAALAAACRDAGIDCLVTANNHAADRRKEGIAGTINRLDSLEIPHTGTFIDNSAKENLYPLMIKKSGFSIALLNYTYSTNGIKVPDPMIINMLYKELVISDIEKARSRNPDLIIMFLHWGNEYDTIPSRTQIDLADYFFSKGVSLIIGSHPHVLQKMVWIKGDSTGNDKIVAYSLGNYVSNQRKPKTDGGSMFRVELVKSVNSLSVASAGYYLTWVYTPIISYEKKFYILPCSEYESKPDFFPDRADYLQMIKFIKDSRALLQSQNLNVKEYIYKGKSWMPGR